MTPVIFLYGLAMLLLVVRIFLRPLMPKIKGRFGEGLVNLTAKLQLDPEVYHLLKDVTIPSRTGTTQIDHIVVSVFGLFVIETKNYNGWIFADAQSSTWTQVHYRQKHRFQNPLRQNYAHIYALSSLLDVPKEHIHGVVCFMGAAKFKTPLPTGVFLQDRYVNFIQSFRAQVWSKEKMAELVRRIESGRLKRGTSTNLRHVRQLHARFSASEPESASGSNPICPACGSDMVLRTARKGARARASFWGCSRYPACKRTRPAPDPASV